jgi:hypothetical protein
VIFAVVAIPVIALGASAWLQGEPTPEPTLSPEAVFAVIGIAGFAVQRVVEFLDPLVGSSIRWARASDKVPTSLDPWETEIKKTLLLVLSFGLASWITHVTGIRLLSLIPGFGEVSGDFLVTALVLSAGTESINSLQKYFSYVKDSRNPALVTLTVTPASAKVVAGQSAQFIAIVRNSPNKLVEWKLLSGPGSIDQNGQYSVALGQTGTAQIAAISKADPQSVGTASITIE